MTATDVTDRVLRRFGPDGESWWSKAKGPRSGTQVCIGQAFAGVLRLRFSSFNCSDYCRTLAEVIREQFDGRVPQSGTDLALVIAFNDHPLTSFPDVRTVVEKTRARMEEIA